MNGCTLCPRGCGDARAAGAGFCGATEALEVASVCIHHGEEPPLGGSATDSGASSHSGSATDSGASPHCGIVNIFFAHCNLHCIYCQNWQISGQDLVASGQQSATTVNQLADRIVSLFTQSHNNAVPQSSTPLLGFVTAAHYANRIPDILDAIHQRGFNPTVVYNSSGYESVDTLRSLEGLVDIYLPDFKYMDSQLAARYSHAPDYPEVATAALHEMIRQVGAGLKVDDEGTAYRGLIVRHLVLPGHVDNSLAVLEKLSTLHSPTNALTHSHINAFTSPLHLSLMAQYYPPHAGLPAPLDRTVTPEEYATVVRHALSLGLTAGWTQELSAETNYRPDFTRSNPFS